MGQKIISLKITCYGNIHEAWVLALASSRGKTPYLQPRGVIMTPSNGLFPYFFVSGYFPTPFCEIKVGWTY